MALVGFTPQAEQSVLELLRQQQEEALLVIDMSQDEVELTLKKSHDMLSLQRDVDLVGPFRVPIGGQEMSLFVRERDTICGAFELDYAAVGGKNCFRLRPRDVADSVAEALRHG